MIVHKLNKCRELAIIAIYIISAVIVTILASLVFWVVRKYRYTLLREPRVIFAIWVAVGLAFAIIYGLIDAIPNMVSFNAEFYQSSGWLEQGMQYLYFSFITISTIGFGDLYPVHWLIKMIVMIESAAGLIIAACLAGSVIFYLTRQASIPRVSTINLSFRAGGECSCGIRLHKFGRVVDDFELGVGFVDDGGVRSYMFDKSSYHNNGQQHSFSSINMDKAFKNLPLSASELFLTYKTTSLAYTHRSYIRLPKKLAIQLKELHEDMKLKNDKESHDLILNVSESKSLDSPPKNRKWWQRKNNPKVVNPMIL